MKLPAVQRLNLYAFFFCIFLFIVAAYIQYGMGLAPCPLCQLQRYCLALVALGFIIAVLHNPGYKGVRNYSILIILFALIGAYFAGKQLWLQINPPQQMSAMCGMSFDYLLAVLPFWKAVMVAMEGSASCSEVSWSFLGISIPGWTLFSFIVLIAIAYSAIHRAKRIR